MPRLSFRLKLLLAMMFVVAGVTAAALLVTEQRVQANYERMFRDQYERLIGYFNTLQEARLGAIQEQCLKLTQSIRLIAIIKEQEADSAERLYEIAEAEFRNALGRGGPTRPGGGARTVRARTDTFYKFLDAKGNVIPDPQAADLARFPQFKLRLEQRLGFIREGLAAEVIQNIAYLPLAVPTNQFTSGRPANALRARHSPPERNDPPETTTLQEIIVTKIIDPHDQECVGALVFGFPLPDLVPQPRRGRTASVSNRVDLIQTGMLIEGQLFANPEVIPEALGEAAAAAINGRIAAGERGQADFTANLDGVPYRIFYEVLNANSKFPPAYQVCLSSMAEARREQQALRVKVIGAGVGALAVALAVSLVISHGLSAPVRRLVAGTGEIQRGNYQVRVPATSTDELGQLAASFNDMAEGLAQKERYRTVLNMVADEKIAQRLVSGELTLGGELREITVLFCDIRGFTALTQNMPPGEVIEMLNEHMTALTRVVKEHHGVLDKFVGDLLMAIFGAPLHHGQDTLNAARCALRLVQVREELNGTSRHQLRIGIGLATGTVVAGCMGSADRLNYTVLGERVNLASRLCDRAAAGEVLMDDATRTKLGNLAAARPTGEIQLKGFAAPVQAFRLETVPAAEPT